MEKCEKWLKFAIIDGYVMNYAEDSSQNCKKLTKYRKFLFKLSHIWQKLQKIQFPNKKTSHILRFWQNKTAMS